MTDNADETILFEAEMRPNCSSSRRALKVLGLTLSAVMVPVALGFSLAGAWPVFGFMGVELIALVALLHYNHRHGNVVERIAVTERHVRLERVNHWGRRENWAFPRHWARINLVGPGAPNSRLEVLSHGRKVALGSFLTATERHEIWSSLRRFLAVGALPARRAQP